MTWGQPTKGVKDAKAGVRKDVIDCLPVIQVLKGRGYQPHGLLAERALPGSFYTPCLGVGCNVTVGQMQIAEIAD